MDELVETEVLEGELEKIVGVFCLALTCCGEFVGDLEVLIEDCLDRIGGSSAEDILGVRNKFGCYTEDIGPRTGEIIRKRASSVHRTHSTVPASCPELGEV